MYKHCVMFCDVSVKQISTEPAVMMNTCYLQALKITVLQYLTPPTPQKKRKKRKRKENPQFFFKSPPPRTPQNNKHMTFIEFLHFVP